MARYKVVEPVLQEQKLVLLRRCIAPGVSLETAPQIVLHRKHYQAEKDHHFKYTSSISKLSFSADRKSPCYIVNPARYEFFVLKKWQPPYVYTNGSAKPLKLEVCDEKGSTVNSNLKPSYEHTPVFHPTLTSAPPQSNIQPITLEIPIKSSILHLKQTSSDRTLKGVNISSTEGIHNKAHLAAMADTHTERDPKGPSMDKPTPSQLSFILLKLREELPQLFGGHHSFDLYSPNVKLENNLSAFSWCTYGRRSYELFLKSSLATVYFCYTQPQLELLKITKQLDSGKIEARWRITGKPRARIRSKRRAVLDGFSTLVVGSDGFITIHKMDKVMPAPKEQSRVQSWMAQLGILLGLSPKPAMELEPP